MNNIKIIIKFMFVTPIIKNMNIVNSVTSTKIRIKLKITYLEKIKTSELVSLNNLILLFFKF